MIEGHINGRILDILRTTDVERISLVNSLFDENGLNLCGKDLFPGMLLLSIFHLASLIPLQLRSIQHPQHFPLPNRTFIQRNTRTRFRPHPYPPPAQALRSLLNNTGIGNEAYVLSFPFSPSFFPSLPLHSSLTHPSPTPSVYHLIPLKCSLTQLTLATNAGIDSTPVPAILLLKIVLPLHRGYEHRHEWVEDVRKEAG